MPKEIKWKSMRIEGTPFDMPFYLTLVDMAMKAAEKDCDVVTLNTPEFGKAYVEVCISFRPVMKEVE